MCMCVYVDLCLWSNVEKVEPVNIGWYASAHGIIPKDANTTALGELAILIVEIF